MSRPRRTRRSRPAALASPDRWLLSYADFITLLFAFFVVLFAATAHDRRSLTRVATAIHSGFSGGGTKQSAALPPAARAQQAAPGLQLPGLAAQLRQELGSSIAAGEVGLAQTPEGLVISLREAGFFDSGAAVLLPGAAAKIERIGELLRRRGVTLRVEGYSDDQPIHTAVFHSNWELSAARAMTVLLLLVDTVHYDPTRVSMAGYGPYRPVADNTTFVGRQLNRRVDLVVLPGS